ncbi:MAG TPA: hypothetical protein VIJ80_02095 [Candidatus Cryosericum sp.]
MGEHKNKAGAPVRNSWHNSEPRTRQTWSTMDNATKRLFMAVLVIMVGALLSMVPGGRIPGYVVIGIGLAWYVVLRLMPAWRTWRSSRRLPGVQ